MYRYNCIDMTISKYQCHHKQAGTYIDNNIILDDINSQLIIRVSWYLVIS